MLDDIDITGDDRLKDMVRSTTFYADVPDELPESDLNDIVRMSKLVVKLKTGSTAWYTDSGLGLVLYAYTCMRAKAAMENISISGYSLGDEHVQLINADPEDNQQIQQWAEDIRIGMNASDVDTNQRPKLRNTSGYIGETHMYQTDTDTHL